MGDYTAGEEVTSFQCITVSEKGQYVKGVSGSDPRQTILQLSLRKKVGVEDLESKLTPASLEQGLGTTLGVCGCRGGKWGRTEG